MNSIKNYGVYGRTMESVRNNCMGCMTEVGEKNIYAVVEFAASDPNVKKDIDLIPNKWITEESDGFSCRYPPSNDYCKLEKYARELRDAKKNWSTYTIKILSYADSYKQGQRRLNRAFTTLDLKSTDDESNKHTGSAKPKILSNVAVGKDLRSILPMQNNTSRISTSRKEKSSLEKLLNDGT
ncbi:Protein of unknown function, partial [Cotesia congregata]